MSKFPDHESDKYWRIDKVRTPTFLSGHYEKDVTDWFKQMIEDCPTKDDYCTVDFGCDCDATHEWFKKWLSQFRRDEE